MSNLSSHLRTLIFLLLITFSSTLFGQGKAVSKVEQLEKKAFSLYQQGQYREACDLYITSTSLRSDANYNRVIGALVIFLLVDVIGVFFFLYIEKRKAYKILVDKNTQCAQLPVMNVAAINYDTLQPDSNADKRILEKVHHLFEQEKIYLDSNLTIESLATKIGCNRQTLSHCINQYMECTFPTLLNRYRVNEAVRLLTSSKTMNYKMESISSMSGYNNRQVFHSAFKKETGLTPSEFKQVAQSKD